jgi:hypothetical protein
MSKTIIKTIRRAAPEDEVFASLIPITDAEKATLEPMTDALFIAATRFRIAATVEQHIVALDRAGFWDDEPRSLLDKKGYVEHKLENLTTPARHTTQEMIDWIQRHYPGVPFVMSEEILDSIARHAHAEQWHPDQLGEALAACAGGIDEFYDDAS